jgi:hypothetical protein
MSSTVLVAGEGRCAVVAALELVFVIVGVALGVWWFSRTNLYRAHRRGSRDPGQHGYGWGTHGMYTHVDPPNRQSHRE